MKFKARIHNVELFQRLAATIEKIGKSCVFHLAPGRFSMIVTSDVTDGMQVWSGMPSSALFDDDMILESISKNEISFDVNLDNLLRALKSGVTAQNVIMKLTKKNNSPFLSFNIDVQTSQVMSIVQDVPITLVSAGQFAQLSEPMLPDPKVNIMLPVLKTLRPIIDRMKNISEFLHINANMRGELSLKVDTDMVSIETIYKNLERPQLEGRETPAPESEAEVRVDIKKFARFLFSYQVTPTNVVCCLVEGKALVLHVMVDDVYLTYYIPVVVAG